MNELTEEDLKIVTKDDVDRLHKKLSSLGNASEKILDLQEKYLSFRLQLIAIAGATFSIYIALHSGATSPGIYTKYGFIALAASLFFGLISISVSFFQKANVIFYEIFDFDKSIDDETDGFKRIMSSMGMTQGIYYSESIKKMETGKYGKDALGATRTFMTSILGDFSFWLGILQIFAFLTSTAFLLLGLLLL